MTVQPLDEPVELNGVMLEAESLIGDLAAAARRHGVIVTITFVPHDVEAEPS